MENTADQYISLANKYRPQTFEDMVGQESISKTLQNALKTGRIGHAYLFYGPRGCGKTTTARILAKALNCTGNGQGKPTAEPCGKCPSCLEIAQSADMDVMELDAASNTQVDKVRDEIIDRVALASSRDRFKVFILDEVHMLSASSFNALLKTIEEPPAHVVFILATTEKHKVPATIVSRCQTFRFRPLTTEEIASHLLDLSEAENIDLSPAAAKVIAKNAGGAMRDALTLLDRAIAFSGTHITEEQVGEMLGLTPQELLAQTIGALIRKDNQALHASFETLKNEGFDANAFLKDIKNTLGDLFYFALGQSGEPFSGAKGLIQDTSANFLAQLTRKINKLIEEVKFSDNALISAEVGLFTIMDSVLDLAGFVRRLEVLERGETLPPAEPPSFAPTQQAPSPKTTKTKPEILHAAARPQEAAAVAAEPEETVEETLMDTEEEPLPEMDAAISNRQIWDKMLALFFKKSPFIYDVMLNCKVQYRENEWTLQFAAGKDFYRKPAQGKLAEMSAAACEISGREIRIVLEEKIEKTAPAQEKQAPKVVISDEEPFVLPEKEAAQPATAPEEVQQILDIFKGELLA